MNYDQIVALLVSRTGNRDDLLPVIETELAAAQGNIESSWTDPTMPWFLRKTGIIGFSPGSNIGGLPSDYLRDQDDGMPLYAEQDVEGAYGGAAMMRKVFPEERAVMELEGLNAGVCGEIGYSISGETMALSSTPTYAAQVTLPYYGGEPPINATNQENQWSKHAPELLIAATGRKLATYIRDSELSQIFAQDAETEATRLILASNERMVANLDLTIRY